jgi:hypothetical protein
MRRLTASLLVLTVLAAPALAQSRRPSPGARQPTAEELQKKKDAAEIENQYKATIKATPAKSATNNDPWALVRGMDGKSGQK